MPPANPDSVHTVLEKEYLRARYAFNSFVDPKLNLEFKSAVLVVNKPLEQRYSQKKQQMALQCGGRDQVNEVFIWHGSRGENYSGMLKNGLLVGGVDPIPGNPNPIPITHGNTEGYGVYSATSPDTPIGIARAYGVDKILCCLAMKGNNSSVAIMDPSQLNNGSTHSFAYGKDWFIFFTKEQILPRYLIEYKIKGT